MLNFRSPYIKATKVPSIYRILLFIMGSRLRGNDVRVLRVA